MILYESTTRRVRKSGFILARHTHAATRRTEVYAKLSTGTVSPSRLSIDTRSHKGLGLDRFVSPEAYEQVCSCEPNLYKCELFRTKVIRREQGRTLYILYDVLSSSIERHNRKRARTTNMIVASPSRSHTCVSATDHGSTVAATLKRANGSETRGSVQRPASRSPTMSRKSWTWIVVVITAAL